MVQNLSLKGCRTSFVILIMMFTGDTAYAQGKKARVLFIGNSYTYVNNLPKLVADVAASNGDTLEYDMSAPGGASFNSHYLTIAATKAKIQAGGWDYLVLQEQSLEPARAPAYFDFWVYLFAKYLVDEIRLHNPCAEIIFYMTWGRKNGYRPFCPQPFTWRHFCTYQSMDSVIRARYMLMTDSNQVTVSPVGAVWRYLRVNYPGLELYDVDESHPSPAGSYAGACSFYTAIFKKPADSISYNFSLPAEDAATIRRAASKVVYDSLSFWRIGKYETWASFNHTVNEMQTVSFENKSANATQYEWNFGDGHTSTQTNPTHTYTSAGIYHIRLVATGKLQCKDTAYASVNISPNPNATRFTITPNPATDRLHITSPLFGQGHCRIQILNSMGQLVYDQRATGATTQTIHIAGLPRGVYAVNIYTTRKPYRTKIIVW
jgi:hypothetical protein